MVFKLIFMKNLKDIIESQNFLVNKKLKNRQREYEYHPKTKEELQNIITDLIKKNITNLNCIDVSEITEMSLLFGKVNYNITVKDIDISEWNVSNVNDMSEMFAGCMLFNADLSNWNVSKVFNMTGMFINCIEFNSDLSKWDVSNVKNMRYMFNGCKIFNSDLSKWNVSKVTDMSQMFDRCSKIQKNNKIPDWYTDWYNK